MESVKRALVIHEEQFRQSMESQSAISYRATVTAKRMSSERIVTSVKMDFGISQVAKDVRAANVTQSVHTIHHVTHTVVNASASLE